MNRGRGSTNRGRGGSRNQNRKVECNITTVTNMDITVMSADILLNEKEEIIFRAQLKKRKENLPFS